MKKSAWLLLLILAVACLDDPDCFRLNNNMMGVSFHVLGSTKADTLYVVGMDISGTDSVFYPFTKFTSVSIPLNYTTDNSRITFHQDGNFLNFLDLTYSVKTQYVSDECGARYILSNLQVTDHNFDSLRVISKTPGTVAPSNIAVYRCPLPHYVGIMFRDLYRSGSTTAKRDAIIQIAGISNSFNETVHYEDAINKLFFLPIDTTANTTAYTIFFPDGTSKNLTLSYKRTYEKRYNVCEPTTYISNLTVENSDFILDEIVVDNQGFFQNTLTDPPQANINLYNCAPLNNLRIDFKQRVPGTANSVRTDTVQLKSVKFDYSSQILYQNTSVTSISIPLNTQANTTTVFLEYDDKTETITFTYTRYPNQTLVTECGPQTIIGKLVINDPIETIKVVKDSLVYPTQQNLEILN
jgi:hypothetical protein